MTKRNYYTYQVNTDYQDTIMAITNQSCSLVAELSYDAWGRRRNTENWSYTGVATSFLFTRGYTGHEHIDAFNLINMNSRVYDPVVGRFISPDNYIQQPGNTQSLNRYSYCINNPLMFTDPSGEFWHLVIGAFVGGAMNWMMNGCQWNAEGLGYFAVGALAGALGAGVGAGVSSVLAGTSFSAGFVGAETAAVAGSSFANGFQVGMSGGLTSGFVNGMGNSLMQGNSMDEAIVNGFKVGIYAGISGAMVGGILGGIDARSNNRHFITGKPPYKDVSLDVPFINQEPESMDCLLANSEMLEKYYGGARNIDDFRKIYNALPEGATNADYYAAAGFKIMGSPENAIHVIRAMEVNKMPTTITTYEGVHNGKPMFHNSTITRVRMWTPKSKAVFWVNDPIRGENYRWTQNDLYKVIWDRFVIGGLK